MDTRATPPPDDDTASLVRELDRGEAEVPRCGRCGYPLVGLDETGQCPECGQPFSMATALANVRPRFRFFLYWMPPFVALTVVWLVLAMMFVADNSIGWGLTFALPASMGFVAGYGFGLTVRFQLMAGVFLAFIVSMGLIAGHMAGVFCGTILGIIGIFFYGVGVTFGSVLRDIMKSVRCFTQRKLLPILLAMLTPAFAEWAEHREGRSLGVESQSTSFVLHATLAEAWNAVAADDPAVDLGASHAIQLTRPLAHDGPSGVGEESIVRFSKGEVRVRVREREPMRRFAFDYVGQTHVEDRAIRLIDTRFDYAPLSPAQTSLTLTTRYEPLMTPRWCWRPFERWAGRETHELVGRQMQRSIDAGRGGG